MTKRKLAVEIAKREGKKSEVAIGNIMEILTILETIMAEEWITRDFSRSDAINKRIGIIKDKLLKKEKKNAKKHPRT